MTQALKKTDIARKNTTKHENLARCRGCGTEIIWRRVSAKPGKFKIKAVEEATGHVHFCPQYRQLWSRKHRKRGNTAQGRPLARATEPCSEPIRENIEQEVCWECGGTVAGGVCLNCGSVQKKVEQLPVVFKD